jgi:hypothetical protein
VPQLPRGVYVRLDAAVSMIKMLDVRGQHISPDGASTATRGLHGQRRVNGASDAELD